RCHALLPPAAARRPRHRALRPAPASRHGAHRDRLRPRDRGYHRLVEVHPARRLARASEDGTMADLTGGHLVARTLAQAGVGHIFTLCGGDILAIYEVWPNRDSALWDSAPH